MTVRITQVMPQAAMREGGAVPAAPGPEGPRRAETLTGMGTLCLAQCSSS